MKRTEAARSEAKRGRRGARAPQLQCVANCRSVRIERTAPGHLLKRVGNCQAHSLRVFWGGDCVWDYASPVVYAVCFDLWGVPMYLDTDDFVSFERCSDALSNRLLRYVESERAENSVVFRSRNPKLNKAECRLDAIDAAVRYGKFRRLGVAGSLDWGWLYE